MSTLTREEILKIREAHKSDGMADGINDEYPEESRDIVILCDMALQSLTPAPAWLPISTAPRDGTTVDLWIDRNVGFRASDVDWIGPESDGFWQDSEGFIYSTDEVTHWMPLPPSPHTGLEKTK